MVETTALGAALAAGFAVGVWRMHSVKSDCDTYVPTTSFEGEYKTPSFIFNRIKTIKIYIFFLNICQVL